MDSNLFKEYHNKVLDGLIAYSNFIENMYFEYLQRIQDEIEDNDIKETLCDCLSVMDNEVNTVVKQLKCDLRECEETCRKLISIEKSYKINE